VQAIAFSKMTNKVAVIRLDFSQNLSQISYLFGANCQTLILTFSPPFGESQIPTKLPKFLVSGKNPKILLISYTKTRKNNNDRNIRSFQYLQNTMSELLKILTGAIIRICPLPHNSIIH
jgi:hypothetical protein